MDNLILILMTVTAVTGIVAALGTGACTGFLFYWLFRFHFYWLCPLRGESPGAAVPKHGKRKADYSIRSEEQTEERSAGLSAERSAGQTAERSEGLSAKRSEGQADGRSEGQTEERLAGQTAERSEGQAAERSEDQSAGHLSDQSGQRSGDQSASARQSEEKSNAERRRRFEEDLKAFEACMNYSAERAYDIRRDYYSD